MEEEYVMFNREFLEPMHEEMIIEEDIDDNENGLVSLNWH
jgi:hypothetical protein